MRLTRFAPTITSRAVFLAGLRGGAQRTQPSAGFSCTGREGFHFLCVHSSLSVTCRCAGSFSPTMVLLQSWKQNHMRRWMCPKESCRAINNSTETVCEACGTDKPRMLGWKCVACSTKNHSGVKKCKQCGEGAEKSSQFWMCAVCEENNRIDEMEDNSRCGFCGYDMAPYSLEEEERLSRAREASLAAQQKQEEFDSISVSDAEIQLGDPVSGLERLPAHLTQPLHASSGPRRELRLPPISAFQAPTEKATRHSRIHPKRREFGALLHAEIPPGPPGFDWMCREHQCGSINPGDEENCMACGTHIKPAEWECPSCAAMNHLSRSACFHCRAAIPVCWTCEMCFTTTSIYDKTCRQCHSERRPAEPKEARDVESFAGLSGFTQQRRQKSQDWYCPACNAMNFSRRVECFQCSAPKPEGAFPVGSPQTGGGDGFSRDTSGGEAVHRPLQNNWICQHCNTSNFRTRKDCWKCGKENAHAGSWTVDSTSPHFEKEGFQDNEGLKSSEGQMNTWKSTDDWTCAKCFSRNSKGRQSCFRCGAQKSTVSAPRRSLSRKPVKL